MWYVGRFGGRVIDLCMMETTYWGRMLLKEWNTSWKLIEGPVSPKLIGTSYQRNLECTPRIKINFDVGFFELDRFQVGVVARNEYGACVWWRARRFLGQPSSVVGEARAAVDKGWTVIVLQGDNSQIIAAIQKREASSLLPYGAFISALLSLSFSFQDFSCSLIRRTGNMLAHSLVHFPLASLDVMEAFDLPADLATIS